MIREKYTARLPKHPVSLLPEHLELVRNRTMPFIRSGTHYSLEHLLAEAYLQGLRDAIQAADPSPHTVPRGRGPKCEVGVGL